jgi:hypothetical protein
MGTIRIIVGECMYMPMIPTIVTNKSIRELGVMTRHNAIAHAHIHRPQFINRGISPDFVSYCQCPLLDA